MKEEKEKPGRQGILPFSSIRTTMLAVFSTLIVATLTFFYFPELYGTDDSEQFHRLYHPAHRTG